ncbi:hypothetical protein [Cohnella hashimotonis]|uniref:Uncharacterized protein n=1 Tax=Cohnella hashimotonis TaxID=2826895 RepID=A0ABT6TJG2_9BACL|nr:hypothetical protein [Cohnella hashimotonis]MDI4646982.1 hypothetical protein [Cohnella hashimotonis]
MSHNFQAQREKRIDDYLDLYNYAVSIKDEQWQQAILAELSAPARDERTEHRRQQRDELIAYFNDVNQTLIFLYRKLQRESEQASREQLWEQIWTLKRIRVEIGKKMRAFKEALSS